MKKILVTNDDGINADGIKRLAECAKKFGEVYVVAPNVENSAASHKINIREPIVLTKVEDFPVEGVHAYMTTGTPADCVRVGITQVLKCKPDVLLSGINFGYNSGQDIQYSATVGAAMEGATSGVFSIAVSEGADGVDEVCRAYLEDALQKVIDKPLEYNQIWNINFPECSLSEFKGYLFDRTVDDQSFYTDVFVETGDVSEGTRIVVKGVYNYEASEGSDRKALLDKYISIGIVNNIR